MGLHRFIYVSIQVFGDMAFLLHWKRHLGINDAQIIVATRDCATQLFKDKLSTYGEDGPHPNEEVFKELFRYAEEISLATETAVKMVNNSTKAAVIARLNEAFDENNFHDQQHISTKVTSAVAWVLDYDKHLSTLSEKMNFYPKLQAIRLTNDTE